MLLNNANRWREKLRGIGKVEKMNVQLRLEMSWRVNEAELGKRCSRWSDLHGRKFATQ